MKEEVIIDGIKYIRADAVNTPSTSGAVIVRSESAGVFFGIPKCTDLSKGLVTLENARRIWYWDGAASLSQLAMDGPSKPENCKFPVAVPLIEIAKVIEVIPCTDRAMKAINAVPIWKK